MFDQFFLNKRKQATIQGRRIAVYPTTTTNSGLFVGNVGGSTYFDDNVWIRSLQLSGGYSGANVLSMARLSVGYLSGLINNQSPQFSETNAIATSVGRTKYVSDGNRVSVWGAALWSDILLNLTFCGNGVVSQNAGQTFAPYDFYLPQGKQLAIFFETLEVVDPTTTFKWYADLTIQYENA